MALSGLSRRGTGHGGPGSLRGERWDGRGPRTNRRRCDARLRPGLQRMGSPRLRLPDGRTWPGTIPGRGPHDHQRTALRVLGGGGCDLDRDDARLLDRLPGGTPRDPPARAPMGLRRAAGEDVRVDLRLPLEAACYPAGPCLFVLPAQLRARTSRRAAPPLHVDDGTKKPPLHHRRGTGERHACEGALSRLRTHQEIGKQARNARDKHLLKRGGTVKTVFM